MDSKQVYKGHQDLHFPPDSYFFFSLHMKLRAYFMFFHPFNFWTSWPIFHEI
jgi:hypothetical protein